MSLAPLAGRYSAKREVVKFEFKLLLRQTGQKTINSASSEPAESLLIDFRGYSLYSILELQCNRVTRRTATDQYGESRERK